MENQTIIEKLNIASKTLSCEREGSTVKFYGKNTQNDLNSVILEVAPHGKVIALYKKDTFLRCGKELTDKLKTAGATPLNIVIDDDFDFVKSAGDVLRAPENVRAVFTADYSLCAFASYVAGLKNLPYIYLMQSASADGIIPATAFVKNGKLFEPINLNSNAHVIIDFIKVYENYNVAEEYLSAISKLCSFTDYRIAVRLKAALPNKTAYGLARQSVSSVYGIMGLNKTDRPSFLLYNSLLLEIANFYSSGLIFDFSALRISEFLISPNSKVLSSLKLDIFCTIAGIFQLLFCGEYNDLPVIINYISRAEYLAKATGKDDASFLQGLRNQINLLKKNSSKITELCEKYSGEVKGHNLAVSKIKQTYIALGGKERKKSKAEYKLFQDAIKHAGDTPYSVNGLTIAREKGILEFI